MKKLLLIAVLALFAVPAHAADRFAEMDRNADGQVNWEEFQAAVPGMKRPPLNRSTPTRAAEFLAPSGMPFAQGTG